MLLPALKDDSPPTPKRQNPFDWTPDTANFNRHVQFECRYWRGTSEVRGTVYTSKALYILSPSVYGTGIMDQA